MYFTLIVFAVCYLLYLKIKFFVEPPKFSDLAIVVVAAETLFPAAARVSARKMALLQSVASGDSAPDTWLRKCQHQILIK